MKELNEKGIATEPVRTGVSGNPRINGNRLGIKMVRIFCFGDSNTYGYDARSVLGERLPKTQRWPDILGELSGWEVVNRGMNGREIPENAWELSDFDRELSGCGRVDLVLIMLGSNDLLNLRHPDIRKIGERMGRFVSHVLEHPAVGGEGKKILLVAPPATEVGRFGEEASCYDRESEKFGCCYREIAERLGIGFADAGSWGIPLAYDGVHITPEGHVRFAGKLRALLG